MHVVRVVHSRLIDRDASNTARGGPRGGSWRSRSRGCVHRHRTLRRTPKPWPAADSPRRTLHSRSQLIHRNVYLPDRPRTHRARRAVAAWLWSGRRATVAGLSASVLHDSQWIAPDSPPSSPGPSKRRTDRRPPRAMLDDRSDDGRRHAGHHAGSDRFDLGRRTGSRSRRSFAVDALANACGVDAADGAPTGRGTPRSARRRCSCARSSTSSDGGAESPSGDADTRLLLTKRTRADLGRQITVLDDAGYPVRAHRHGRGRSSRSASSTTASSTWTSAAHAHDIDRHAKLLDSAGDHPRQRRTSRSTR